MLRFPIAGQMNLAQYAENYGVDPSRIIFTDVAPKWEHISRGHLADVFFDTPMCNAHTTATDILWGGVPIITLPLEKMASRVGASVAIAVGIPELVALVFFVFCF